MADPILPPLPDQLFVLDRDHEAGEFLDMLLTLCTFGISVGLLLVDRGVAVMTAEHRGIPVTRFHTMGLCVLLADTAALNGTQIDLPDTVTAVDEDQIHALYRRVPRILHP